MTEQLIAEAGITIKREKGRGFVLRQNGVEIDAPQRNKRDAQSVAVAYALGYMA